MSVKYDSSIVTLQCGFRSRSAPKKRHYSILDHSEAHQWRGILPHSRYPLSKATRALRKFDSFSRQANSARAAPAGGLVLLVVSCSFSLVADAARFGDDVAVTIGPNNASTASEITSQAGFSSVIQLERNHDDVIAELKTVVPSGQEWKPWNGTLVRYSIDLLPPNGVNSYIGAMNIDFTLDCGGTDRCYAAFGARRNASCDGCSPRGFSPFSTFCDGQFTGNIVGSTGNTTVQRLVLSWRNANWVGIGEVLLEANLNRV